MPRPSLVSGDVRRHNLTVILEHIARTGPSARSEIADATGLTKGAVTALATALTDTGVLRESSPVASTRGRPITRLELAAPDIAILALQLDADTATALLTTLAGEELHRHSASHGRPMGSPDPVIDVLAAVARSALGAASELGRRILALPVVVFAPIDGDPAVVLADTDLDWGIVDVIGGLRARVPDLPAIASLVSDGWLAAEAERALLGDVNDLIYLRSNSGIGGAIITGGRFIEGAHGGGGAALGHLPVVPDGELCACGQHGCLVTVAGPDILLERAGLAELAHENGLAGALAELSARISADEPAAAGAWRSAVPWIARALQITSIAIDPATIVIGGFWAAHTDSIEDEFHRNRPTIARATPDAPAVPAVVPGQLGADAALLGAVRAARTRLLGDPSRLGSENSL